MIRPSFWLEGLDFSVGEQFEGDISVDFVILGGGFTGLATAYFLKEFEPSAGVAVLEKDYCGFGASGRNAGFCMTLFGFNLSWTALRYGKTNALEAYRYAYDAVSLVKELVQKHNIDCDFQYNGFIRLATSRAYERRLKKEFDFARSLGIEDAQWLDRSEISEKINSPLVRAGWYERHCALLNPAKLVRGMKKVVESKGVMVFERTPVNQVRRTYDRGIAKIEVTTPRGRVLAEKVLFATNAFSHLIPQLKRRQVPAFTHIVLTEPISEERLAKLGWKGREGLEDSRNLIHYFRLTDDNRLLMGGGDVSIAFGKDMSRDLNFSVFSHLESFIEKIFPQLKGVKIEARWGGPVSITVDLIPALGYIGDKRALYSVGCIGHGVSLSHMNGLTLAELLLEKETQRTKMFFVNRFVIPWPPEPIRFLVSHAIRGAMKFQDAIYDRL